MQNSGGKWTVLQDVIYSVQLDYAGGANLIYFGLAVPGSSVASPVWQIRKLAYDGSNNLLSMLYANGARDFNQVWNNRVSLSYS
jgi:hypothetical protein